MLLRSALHCPRAFPEPGTIHKCDAILYLGQLELPVGVLTCPGAMSR